MRKAEVYYDSTEFSKSVQLFVYADVIDKMNPRNKNYSLVGRLTVAGEILIKNFS